MPSSHTPIISSTIPEKSQSKIYGTCSKCGEPRFHHNWCRQCEFYKYQSAYPDWSSNNQGIDLVIKSIQANAGSIFSFIEWIEYEKFQDVEYIGKGSFSKVYKAKWKEGPRDGPPTFEEDKVIDKMDILSINSGKSAKSVVSNNSNKSRKSNKSNKSSRSSKSITDRIGIWGLTGSNRVKKKERQSVLETQENQQRPMMPKWNRRGYTTVVLKSISKSQNMKPQFFSELRTLSRCVPDDESYNVPGLLRVYGLTRNPTTKEFMLVSQYAEQHSLYEYLDTKPHIPLRQTVSILKSIALGLHVIHRSGLIHGNLHGGNILIDASHCAYIGDAGISNFADPPKNSVDPVTKKSDSISQTHDSTSQRTASTFKRVSGVIPYVDPEIILGGTYTNSSDIYSFGVIMWQLWSGQRPFIERAHDLQLCVDIYNGLRPCMTEDMPGRYREIVAWCLDMVPGNRPSADELLVVLEELEDESEGSWDGVSSESEGNVRQMLHRERRMSRSNLKTKYFSRFMPFSDNLENVDECEYGRLS